MSKRTDRHQRPWARRRPFLTLRVQRRGPSKGGIALAAGLVSVVFVGVVISVAVLHRQEHTGLATAEPLPSGGDVRLSAKKFDDSQAHFYRYTTTGGRAIRFFVIKTPDGVVRSSFDSCELCYKQRRGYRQAGDMLVCNACGRTFPSVRINVAHGGCNPASLEGTVEGDQVLLKAASLELGAAYF